MHQWITKRSPRNRSETRGELIIRKCRRGWWLQLSKRNKKTESTFAWLWRIGHVHQVLHGNPHLRGWVWEWRKFLRNLSFSEKVQGTTNAKDTNTVRNCRFRGDKNWSKVLKFRSNLETYKTWVRKNCARGPTVSINPGRKFSFSLDKVRQTENH